MKKKTADISKMNLEHLKTFHVVATLGSFTEAANALFLTQPAVSQQIRGLENALRNPLFDRRKKQIRLTPRGKILFTHTTRLFGIFEEIQNVFNDLNHLQVGELTIAASAVMGNYFLPDLLAEFSKRYPLISIRLEMGDSAFVTDLVDKGIADFGLSRHVPDRKKSEISFLHKEPYVCVCAPASPFAQYSRPLTPKELAENYLVMRQRGSRMRSKIEEWMTSVGVLDALAKPMIEVNSLESSKQLLKKGIGIAAFPLIAVKNEMKLGELTEIKVEQFSVDADYFLSVDETRELSPAAFKFISMIKSRQPE